MSIDLDPGTYWLVTGGAEAAPADLTLLGLKDGMTVAAPVMDPIVDDAERLEPAAGATIDRLVQVELVQGYRGTMSVLLAGECFGTPADLVNRLTCVDRAGVRLPLPTTVVDGDLTPILPRPPLWSAEIDAPCTLPPRAGSGLREEDICVPGGVFLMGDTLALTDLDLRTRPEHMRVVAPFFLDRFEFTVGRYKAALAAGFVPKTGDPFANEAPVIKPDTSACTYSATGNGRDAFPLTCVSAYVARALCQFVGADLPTEDQWEYAATAAGRPIETQYAWGDDLPPGCEHAAVERADTNADRCKQLGYGPVAVDDPLYLAGDTTKLGLVGLGGNVQEWLQTGLYAYDHEVWRNAGLHDALPALANDTAPLRATRGGDWAGFGLFTTASARRALAPAGRFDNGGFRCARPGR